VTGSFDQFLNDLAVRESTGVYNPGGTPNFHAMGANGLNYLGAFQFDEWAMNNLGYYKEDGDMNSPINWKQGFFTGKDGINSAQDFLNNPAEQIDAAHHWMTDKVWGFVKNAGLDQYIGQTIDGVHITATGLLAGAHLRGADAVKAFITSGGSNDPTDPYGTHVSDYMSHFSDYASPFDTGSGTASTGSTGTTTGSTGTTTSNTHTGGTDTLQFKIAEDAYRGDASFIVKVDGKQVGDVHTAHASHAAGAWDTVTVSGDFANAHQVSITFTNDLYGGTGAKDRNLYVGDMSMNGHTVHASDATIDPWAGQHQGNTDVLSGNGSVLFHL
jgi:hypothetical protein